MSERITDEHRALAAASGVSIEPDPIPTDAPSAHDLVIADMQARKAFGLAKYNTVLQHDNGRDHLQDAYEEVLDCAAYLRNEIEKRRAERAGSRRLAVWQLHLAYTRLGEMTIDPEVSALDLYEFRHRELAEAKDRLARAIAE